MNDLFITSIGNTADFKQNPLKLGVEDVVLTFEEVVKRGG